MLKEMYAIHQIDGESKFNQQIIYAGVIDEETIDARLINRSKNGIEIVPYNFKVFNKNILHYFKECATIGSVMKVHGNIIHKAPSMKTDKGIVITGNKLDYLEILGGRLDKNVDIVYSIETLDSISAINEESSNQETSEDVNEFGF